MVSIRNNKNGQIIFNVKGKQISLIPGVSVGIDDELWKIVKNNSTCKKFIDVGILEELKKPPEPKGKLENFDVYDDENEEPTPIVNTKEDSQKSTKKTGSRKTKRKVDKT